MSGTSSERPDGAGIDCLQAIAASIFARQGVDFAAARRAGGWTNAVWMADEWVLRLSTTEGNESLLREARLAALLPPEVGYPTILETGKTEGFAWSLAARLPGRSLEEIWADLSWEERSTALRGVWQRAQAVHAVPAAKVAALVPRRSWFNSTDAEEAEAGLDRLTHTGILSTPERRVLRDALGRFWNAAPAAPCALCHGDLTLGNAVWHAGQVISLLDFEFAVLAPVLLDLNHLVKCAFGPDDAARLFSSADREGAWRLRQAVKELALPLLAQPGSKDLLAGYAVLLELWLLELWLAHPEGEGPLEQWEPLRRLRSLADGACGYLAALTVG